MSEEDRRKLKEVADSIEKRIITLEAQVQVAKARFRQKYPGIAVVIFDSTEKKKVGGE